MMPRRRTTPVAVGKKSSSTAAPGGWFGSRGAGDGSRNYVVFDENLINIVKKYGVAGAATMLGVSQAEVAQAMEGQQ